MLAYRSEPRSVLGNVTLRRGVLEPQSPCRTLTCHPKLRKCVCPASISPAAGLPKKACLAHKRCVARMEVAERIQRTWGFRFPIPSHKGKKPLDLAAVLKRKIQPAFAKVGIIGAGWHTFRPMTHFLDRPRRLRQPKTGRVV